jgi:hypothetical protein
VRLQVLSSNPSIRKKKRKERVKEGRKERRKEGRKERKKERGRKKICRGNINVIDVLK